VQEYIRRYRETFADLIHSIMVTDGEGVHIDTLKAIETSGVVMKTQAGVGGKVMLIGNGASAAIASHTAIDLWNNGIIKAATFNDSALLTCIGNDFGYEQVYAKPISFFGESKDIVVAISSSGRSKNILNAVDAARSRGIKIITMSGFDEDNPLRTTGMLNFYVPSSTYGLVESVHQYICHWVTDSAAHGNS
jgi:D-sedoheptulose 7-phosphate isomerase